MILLEVSLAAHIAAVSQPPCRGLSSVRSNLQWCRRVEIAISILRGSQDGKRSCSSDEQIREGDWTERLKARDIAEDAGKEEVLVCRLQEPAQQQPLLPDRREERGGGAGLDGACGRRAVLCVL